MQGLVVVHQQIYVDLEEAHVLLIVIVKEIWCVIIGESNIYFQISPLGGHNLILSHLCFLAYVAPPI